jgi:sortase (surface protein transpeptidase)
MPQRALRLVVGLALLVAAPALWWSTRPAVDVGTPPSTLATMTAPVPASRPLPTPAPRDEQAPPPTEPPAPSSSPFTSTAPRGAVDLGAWPTGVRIAAIDVDAPVLAVGVEPDGALVVPESVLDVGWYQGSVVPGTPGVTLLTSHLDTRAQGRGVFAGLVELEVGDLVELEDARGTVTAWRVVAREQRRKDDLPEELFARSGAPLLALVTCGGPFDPASRSYRDNVIVWAEPMVGSG